MHPTPLRIRLARPAKVLVPAMAWLCSLGAAAPEKPAEEPRAKEAPTFNRDIAPLLFRNCASCHRPGEVAPFPLLSYRDASKRAKLIRKVVESRIMPPWKAEHGGIAFADERRLTAEQIATIARWAEAGAPEGDAADLPAAPRFAAGWQLGEPDQVVTMAEPYHLVADGPDLYRCFVIPVRIPAGKYLESVEYRPGNRKVVHHAVLTTLPQASAKARLASGDGKSFGSGLAPPGELLPGPLAFWTPGMVPRPLPEGYAAEWPADADLVLQLHLHPSGKPETEQSSIGFHFTDRKPKGRLRISVLSNNAIDIPPGEPAYVVEASRTLRDPVDLCGIFPHMHLIGRSVAIKATLPDGTVRSLIKIDDWDFNWQHYYQLATPLRLPAGTKLEGKWTYDNSAENPANPSRPPKRVRYGEQTANEMAIAVLDVLPATGAPKPPSAGPAMPEDPAKRAAEVLRRADKDGDGGLQLAEVLALFNGRATRDEVEERFDRFDRNKDGRLDPAELTEAIKVLRRR